MCLRFIRSNGRTIELYIPMLLHIERKDVRVLCHGFIYPKCQSRRVGVNEKESCARKSFKRYNYKKYEAANAGLLADLATSGAHEQEDVPNRKPDNDKANDRDDNRQSNRGFLA